MQQSGKQTIGRNEHLAPKHALTQYVAAGQVGDTPDSRPGQGRDLKISRCRGTLLYQCCLFLYEILRRAKTGIFTPSRSKAKTAVAANS
jgi:hypothetical protein